jgi:HD-like signal output (HDOD) protein
MEEPGLIDQELERVALSIGIPPCPAILVSLAAETRKEDPNLIKIEQLVSKDVGLSATLLKTVNSPFYGLSSKIGTVKQAINLLGLTMLTRTISALILKQSLSSKDPVSMERFWDSSGKLAIAASIIAKQVRGINRESAYTYGLFQNCGIPILMQRFPDYKQTLNEANYSVDRRFTEIEDATHGTDHATIGYLLTKSWNLPEIISHAIRFHHDYSILAEGASKHSSESLHLIALGMLADHAVQLHTGQNFSLEWPKGGPLALEHFGLNEQEFLDMIEDDMHLLD